MRGFMQETFMRGNLHEGVRKVGFVRRVQGECEEGTCEEDAYNHFDTPRAPSGPVRIFDEEFLI